MMPPRMLAEVVTDSLAESNPARLVELVESRQLVMYLEQKIQAFDLQYVRMMEGRPRAADPMVMECLLPMLMEHPTQKQPQALTPAQNQMVEEALDQYEEQSNSQVSPSAAISD